MLQTPTKLLWLLLLGEGNEEISFWFDTFGPTCLFNFIDASKFRKSTSTLHSKLHSLNKS